MARKAIMLRIAVLMAAMLVLVCFSGCGLGTNVATPTSTQASPENTRQDVEMAATVLTPEPEENAKEGVEQVSQDDVTDSDNGTQTDTTADVIETPEMPETASGLMISSCDSAYMVTSAVVGGYLVYLEANMLYSVPLSDLGAEPTLLQAETIPFHVWNGYVMVYAKPDDDTPYRSILIAPDGIERRIIDKRQRDFYNPVAGVADYCYFHTDKFKRYSITDNSIETLFSIVGSPVGVIGGYLYTIDYGADDIWRYDIGTGLCEKAFHWDSDITAIAARGFVFVYGVDTPAFALFADGTVCKLSDGPVWPRDAWANIPEAIIYSEFDGSLEGGNLGSYCVRADGVYPISGTEGGLLVETGPDGNAYIVNVDMDGFLPMSGFLEVDWE